MIATAPQPVLAYGCLGCWVELDASRRSYCSGCEPWSEREGNDAMTTTEPRAAQRIAGRPTIELHCRLCGKPYTPTADDLRRGPETYHRCPDCRLAEDAGEKAKVPA
jgi:hypothetical protein